MSDNEQLAAILAEVSRHLDEANAGLRISGVATEEMLVDLAMVQQQVDQIADALDHATHS